MLIYLDANIVQYCADYDGFLFRIGAPSPAVHPNLLQELQAIRGLIQLEQLGNWEFAAPECLLQELHHGRPTPEQIDLYRLLESSASGHAADPATVESNIQRLLGLTLNQVVDRRHVATAIAMGASWFLTNDRNIIDATSGRIAGLRVARPSECLADISVGIYLKT